jgi:hypothetical protein
MNIQTTHMKLQHTLRKITIKCLCNMIQKLIQKIESKILTKLFMRWVDKEWDLELLQMTGGMISARETEIKSLIDMATRKEVYGFKRYD